MNDGFIRLGAATPAIHVADCAANADEICRIAREACEAGVNILCFPELCVTGYTCGDLFLEPVLLKGAEAALCRIMKETAGLPILLAVGVPVEHKHQLYNCAAFILNGNLLGLVPKRNIPNYSEFYEARHFTPGPALETIVYCGQEVSLGYDLLFTCENFPGLTIGAEICEDLWVANPPSTRLAMNGATVLLNLSASDETIGKTAYRRELVKNQSARLLAAYVYADAGVGESSTDMVFAGQDLICENGALLAESEPYSTGFVYADIDIERLCQERRRMNTWTAPDVEDLLFEVSFTLPEASLCTPERVFPCLPFVPSDTGDLDHRCRDILAMQSAGLRTRLAHTRCTCAVVGLSGGLDSTLALLVTVRAFDSLNLPRTGIQAVTMPCFGTTSRTRSNAEKLAAELGVSFSQVTIGKAVEQHFSDIGHDPDVHDVTYENCQARERTQVLMDIANQKNGLVIGTGDLSELALGWATYNGDHMSMYGVNASIPKTLVRYLVRYCALIGTPALREVLEDILDTPVSPELLPPVDGQIAQKTEDLVGPYELHDFFLYYMLRFHFAPGKIYRMAQRSFAGTYDDETIKKWLRTFYRRFFIQQFKRSCLPDGPKVGSVTLSPRGDWRMPSDACSKLWLDEIDRL